MGGLPASRPTLSVLMANYNHGRFIGEALRAILAQSFKPAEVIVLDDASTDDSVDVIETVAREDSTVTLLRNEKNAGVVAAVNRMLETAAGDYIYSAAADDRVLPGLFEKSMSLLSDHPQAALCCSDPIYFDVTGEERVVRLGWRTTLGYLSPGDLSVVIRKHGEFIYGHTAILRTAAVREAGGLDARLKWHCDWYLLHLIGFRFGICYLPEPLAAMRTSAASYSARGTVRWSEQRQVLDRLFEILGASGHEDVRRHFRDSGIMAHFGAGLLRAIATNPEYWRREYAAYLPGLRKTAKMLLWGTAPLGLRSLYATLLKK